MYGEESASEWFRIFDTDGDGELSKEELIAAFQVILEDGGDDFANLEGARAGIIGAYDLDGSGYLEKNEVEALIKLAGDCGGFTVEKLIAIADRNGDGKLSLEEYTTATAFLAGNDPQRTANILMEMFGNDGELCVSDFQKSCPMIQFLPLYQSIVLAIGKLSLDGLVSYV